MFALVDTAQLVAAEPHIEAALGADVSRQPGHLTAIEQDEFHAGGDLAADLERIAWPEAVVGCALAVERVFVPPAEDPDAAAEFVNTHPQREDVRVVVAVNRGGDVQGIARLKSAPEELLIGSGLVPGLARALARTLE